MAEGQLHAFLPSFMCVDLAWRCRGQHHERHHGLVTSYDHYGAGRRVRWGEVSYKQTGGPGSIQGLEACSGLEFGLRVAGSIAAL